MQTDNRLLDDLSRIATGALGALHGVKGEVEQAFRQRLEKALADVDLVTREEFEAVKAMAEAAREENIRLAERLAALESKQNG
ncbi:MAG: accessory factor UbiK family protein [Ferrovibrio sp.]|uniref:accessory factor UbiK family protein n=1 Tax=Ferrovibrio sp. TaxID=1917215 RepID=UPI00391B3B50